MALAGHETDKHEPDQSQKRPPCGLTLGEAVRPLLTTLDDGIAVAQQISARGPAVDDPTGEEREDDPKRQPVSADAHETEGRHRGRDRSVALESDRHVDVAVDPRRPLLQ